MKKKLALTKITIFAVFLLLVFIFMENNSFMYSKDICKITSVTERIYKVKENDDGDHTYKEKYIRQDIEAQLVNGKHKGHRVHLTNKYEKSRVYTTGYSKGDKIFVDNLSYVDSDRHKDTASAKLSNGSTARKSFDGGKAYALTGSVAGAKRDTFVVMALAVLFGLFLLVGGSHGLLTIFSLLLNMGAFYVVLILHSKGTNILFTTIPMSIFFTAMLLFFMYGKNIRTYLSFFGTVITILITMLLSALVINFGGKIDYDFMDYLTMPYSQRDATFIFLSEILVGSLGAVMDVVVTIVMTVDRISATAIAPERKDFIASCRAVGDDLIGTMTALMFFTNIAACLPNFILSLRNGIAFRTILRYNTFFETARFLTGSIAIVLAIPIASYIAIHHYMKKRKPQPLKAAEQARGGSDAKVQ